jgi:hypothetical protein
VSLANPRLRWDIPEDKLEIAVGGIVGALAAHPEGLDDLQWEMLEAIVTHVFCGDLDVREVEPVSPERLAETLVLSYPREIVVHLMVTLAFARHPESPEVALSIERYAAALGVDEPMVHAARHYADHHAALLYFDIERNSEFTEQTVNRMLHGHFWRIIRNKLSYTGVVADGEIARHWETLDSCRDGSWGHAVAEFYHRHKFPYPGERHGIAEVGARHDWIHVLAGYDPTPEGEIDVFAFIAASMPDPRGFAQFVMTLGLFQNGTIRHVAGQRIQIARDDTLSDPGAISRWADALRRGASCNIDVMNLDHFEYKNFDIEEVQDRFGVLPKETDAEPVV